MMAFLCKLSSSGCTKITVMVPFRIVPDIWKGSEGYMRP
jgi:hypothetical protein